MAILMNAGIRAQNNPNHWHRVWRRARSLRDNHIGRLKGTEAWNHHVPITYAIATRHCSVDVRELVVSSARSAMCYQWPNAQDVTKTCSTETLPDDPWSA